MSGVAQSAAYAYYPPTPHNQGWGGGGGVKRARVTCFHKVKWDTLIHI